MTNLEEFGFNEQIYMKINNSDWKRCLEASINNTDLMFSFNRTPEI